ncbi:unnamed protein product, partial [Prorocentrum cordatum]
AAACSLASGAWPSGAWPDRGLRRQRGRVPAQDAVAWQGAPAPAPGVFPGGACAALPEEEQQQQQQAEDDFEDEEKNRGTESCCRCIDARTRKRIEEPKA